MNWPVTYARKIRYSDTDSQGIVFNGNYLTYFDDTITDLFEAAGLTAAVTHAAGYDVVTAHASVDFRATATLGDVLVTGVRIARVGTTSITFELQCWTEQAETVTADGKVVFVTVDAESFTAIPVPDSFVDTMQALHTEPIDR